MQKDGAYSKKYDFSVGQLRNNVHKFMDLASLSTSSVAPAFSIAASYGVIAFYLGIYSIMGVIIVFPVYLFASIIFRKFNRLYPNAGASYFWGSKIVSKSYGSFQAWIITLAYFFSIPPIVIPAGEYTAQFLYSLGIISFSLLNNAFTIFILGSFWILITLIAGILGARPTAKITELFLGVELFVIIMFSLIAIYYLPDHMVNHISFSWFFSFNEIVKKPYAFVLAFPVIATIMDGWEIDSYASEESFNREKWPGTTGIMGFLTVFSIYMITMTLMDAETPLNLLSGSIDPLAEWASYIIPKYAVIMYIAVIASTASSLWLTTYILSRAWYAMSRDHLFPQIFGYTHKKYKSPWSNLVIIAVTAEAINAFMLFIPSIESFFAQLLSISGIFLMMEFAFDAFSGIYLFKGSKNILYLLISIITFIAFIFMIIMGIATSTFYIALAVILLIPGILMFFIQRNGIKLRKILN
ncbi:APC family permease [Acidiplasma sp.]|uniref:APC family permease n=1 Tax=Acidiplasma sp. TaxID=1872114 RepID=UPI002588AD6A|nr:APC family permease [Acidiplasma sp.]